MLEVSPVMFKHWLIHGGGGGGLRGTSPKPAARRKFAKKIQMEKLNNTSETNPGNHIIILTNFGTEIDGIPETSKPSNLQMPFAFPD